MRLEAVRDGPSGFRRFGVAVVAITPELPSHARRRRFATASLSLSRLTTAAVSPSRSGSSSSCRRVGGSRGIRRALEALERRGELRSADADAHRSRPRTADPERTWAFKASDLVPGQRWRRSRISRKPERDGRDLKQPDPRDGGDATLRRIASAATRRLELRRLGTPNAERRRLPGRREPGNHDRDL